MLTFWKANSGEQTLRSKLCRANSGEQTLESKLLEANSGEQTLGSYLNIKNDAQKFSISNEVVGSCCPANCVYHQQPIDSNSCKKGIYQSPTNRPTNHSNYP